MDVLMRELFSSDIGLLSLFTIAFIIVMAVFIYKFVRRHIAEDRAAAEQQKPQLRT